MHDGHPTHKRLPIPKSLDWNLCGFESEIEVVKKEFEKLV